LFNKRFTTIENLRQIRGKTVHDEKFPCLFQHWLQDLTYGVDNPLYDPNEDLGVTKDGAGGVVVEEIIQLGDTVVQSEEVAPTELQHEAMAPAELQHEEVAPAELQHVDVAPAELQHEEMAPAERQHKEVAPAELQQEVAPAELQHVEMAPAQLQHEEVAPAELQHVEVAPAERQHVEVPPAELQQEEVAPAKLQHKEVGPTQLQHEEVAPVELQHKEKEQNMITPSGEQNLEEIEQAKLESAGTKAEEKDSETVDVETKTTTVQVEKDKRNILVDLLPEDAEKIIKPEAEDILTRRDTTIEEELIADRRDTGTVMNNVNPDGREQKTEQDVEGEATAKKDDFTDNLVDI
jgi:hypothetical protein